MDNRECNGGCADAEGDGESVRQSFSACTRFHIRVQSGLTSRPGNVKKMKWRRKMRMRKRKKRRKRKEKKKFSCTKRLLIECLSSRNDHNNNDDDDEDDALGLSSYLFLSLSLNPKSRNQKISLPNGINRPFSCIFLMVFLTFSPHVFLIMFNGTKST